MIFIFIGALAPFPFDLLGLAAGLLKYDMKKFFIAMALGKILRFGIIFYSGMYSVGIVKDIFF